MASNDVTLTQYRLVGLHWDLKEDFSGTLHVEPEIQFGIPTDRSPMVRCQYKLDITGKDSELMFLSITAEGIFKVTQLPEVKPGVLDRERLIPITDVMEQKLIESVERITQDLGIPKLTLTLSKNKA